jgi:transposase
MKTRKPYPTDLSDAQWRILEAFIPSAKAGGRPETYPKREVLNGIFGYPFNAGQLERGCFYTKSSGCLFLAVVA